ncbi:MAG: response regulator [Fibrella sp.]|nr:response regulator [Armatimonadota bacterium]
MSLFVPAAALMNRLRYPAKFALITVLFIIPIAWGSVQFWQSIDRNATFSAKENIGNDYLRPLVRLLLKFPQARLAQLSVLRDVDDSEVGWEEAQAEVRRILSTIGAEDARSGAVLESSGEYAALRNNWEAVVAAKTPETIRAAHETFLNTLQSLIKTVGDNSNLILDPDLDTYYLMDATLLKLPEAGAQFVQAQARLDEASGDDTVGPEQKAKLIGIASLIRADTAQLRKGFGTAIKYNPTGNIEPRLTESFNRSIAAREELVTALEGRADGFSSPDVYNQLNAAIQTSADFADKAFTENGILIRNRVQGYRDQQRNLVILSASSLVLALYLLVGFYQSVVTAVKKLEAAATQLLQGGADVDIVRLETQDELGQVAGSFNTVLSRFKSESEQAREERTRAEEAEENHRTIFENANEGIYQTTREGGFIRVNPGLARICGYASPAQMMESVRNVGTELYADRLRRNDYTEAIEQNGSVTNWESQILRADGETIWVAESAHAVKDAQGVVRYYEGTITDITAEKNRLGAMETAREAAEAANRAKSDFLAKMSHELRTPLNAVIGYSEILQEEAEEIGQDDFVPDLKKINAAGKHLLGLINDILDLSKIEAGKMELYLEQFLVAEMVNEVANTVKPLMDKNGNTLTITVAPEVRMIRADLTKVRQNLFNLLSNASKFTERGEITLDVNPAMDAEGVEFVDFAVRDTGIGMTPEQRSRLFHEFVQADNSTTRKYGGTGLGLVIVKRFAQMMGGDVSVTSEYGKGSTFVFRVPVMVADTKNYSGGTPDEEVEAARTKSPVLVIDDDSAVLDLTARLLIQEGYTVVTATNGYDGLRMARQTMPQVILLDIMMPHFDGWSVLAALKEDTDLARIPVIIQTFTDNKAMALALGASDYLPKPVDKNQLVQMLGRYRPTSTDRQPSALLVEDDPLNRDLLKRLLNAEGWHVTEAENGRVGLEMLTVAHPHLILLDIMMPEVDGFGFVEGLRERIEWRDVPVVVVTAKDLTSEDFARLNGTVTAVLQKGRYHDADILQLVRRFSATTTGS